MGLHGFSYYQPRFDWTQGLCYDEQISIAAGTAELVTDSIGGL